MDVESVFDVLPNDVRQAGVIGFQLARLPKLLAFQLVQFPKGNDMGRFRQNYFAGIRTPWTLADERVWRKTHRVGARWMMMVGVFDMILIPILPLPLAGIVFLVSILGVMFAIMGYSYIVYRDLN